MMTSRKWLIAAILILTLGLTTTVFTAVGASSTGRTGFSGNPATNGGAICTACHSGGVAPEVTFNGPMTVTAGQTVTFTLTISGGQEAGGGFNVSATRGNLTLLPGATDVQEINDELTHTAPKAVDGNNDVVFTFRWTAPDYGTSAILYGAGNSVNLSGTPDGDAPATDTLSIAVLGPTSVSLTSVGGSAAAPSLLIWLIPAGGLLLLLLLAAIRYRKTDSV